MFSLFMCRHAVFSYRTARISSIAQEVECYRILRSAKELKECGLLNSTRSCSDESALAFIREHPGRHRDTDLVHLQLVAPATAHQQASSLTSVRTSGSSGQGFTSQILSTGDANEGQGPRHPPPTKGPATPKKRQRGTRGGRTWMHTGQHTRGCSGRTRRPPCQHSTRLTSWSIPPRV